jgi:chloramphenicol-sensitive protein RarD
MRRGIIYAALAYICWGLFPLYFKALQNVAPLEVLAHRVLWSLVFVALVLLVQRHWSWLGKVRREPRLARPFVASATVIALNWFVYIWAVVNGHVVEASLGYFINPLVNVLVGRLVLKERLRPGQWAAVALAALGVLWLTVLAGKLPWIALVLAFSFATYGLLRKTAPLGALEGLVLESSVLAPFALAGLLWAASHGHASFPVADAGTQWLLVAAGPITAIPLLLFAAGARRIPFSLLGLLQYFGPTLQLLIGVRVFDESFEPARAAGFAAIWLALVVYSAEGWWQGRRSAAAPA